MQRMHPELPAAGAQEVDCGCSRVSCFANADDSVQPSRMAFELELELQEGDKAPDFSAETNGGGNVKLADFKGKNVILYFYPRDDTPGCTKEACGFRDRFAAFKKKGAVVLGVSVDPVKAHDKFVEKYKLPFPLLVDVDKKIVEAYGVWGQKVFMGRKYLGVHRVTFLIGPDGKIKKIWPKVKPEEHAEEVLAAL
jgi:peroxiredoxin Q/BCP